MDSRVGGDIICELTCLGLGSLMRYQYLKGFTLHLLILIHVLYYKIFNNDQLIRRFFLKKTLKLNVAGLPKRLTLNYFFSNENWILRDKVEIAEI